MVQEWSAVARFKEGDRVRARQDEEHGPGPWPSEPTGVLTTDGVEIESPMGSQRFYWMTFDEPQRDADGDGPYRSSQVNEIYLEPVPPVSA